MEPTRKQNDSICFLFFRLSHSRVACASLRIIRTNVDTPNANFTEGLFIDYKVSRLSSCARPGQQIDVWALVVVV